MDNTQGTVVPSPNIDPSQMKPMGEQGQEAPPQKQVPDTTEEAKAKAEAETADVAAEKPEAPVEDKSQEDKEFQMPEKFQGKSAEEIAKSYVDLEAHNKKVEMDKAEMDKFISEAYPEPESPTPEQKTEPEGKKPEGSEKAEMTREEALKQVAEELRPMLREEMSKAMTPAVARLEIKEMVDKYGDSFKAVASKVAARKKANPSLALEDAYKLETYSTVGRISEIKGVQKASQTAEEKLKAQVESSRPSGLKPVGIEEAVKDKNVPYEEITEALGPEYSKFAEITKRRKKQT